MGNPQSTISSSEVVARNTKASMERQHKESFTERYPKSQHTKPSKTNKEKPSRKASHVESVIEQGTESQQTKSGA